MPIPYLTVADPRAAIARYTAAFGAREVMTMDGPGDSIMHAELDIDGERLMLSGVFEGFADAPIGRSPVNFMRYVDDLDAAIDRAVAAGMRLTGTPELQFWGDRTVKLDDGHGYEWTFAQQVELLSNEEIQRRATAYADAMSY